MSTVANSLLQVSPISSSVTLVPSDRVPSTRMLLFEVSTSGFVHASTSSCENTFVEQLCPVREPVLSTQA